MEKQTVAAPVPQLIGTAPIPNIGIPVSGGNPSSYVRAVGNGSIPSAHPDWQPSLVSLMIGTEMSHNLGIPASVDNLVKSVQAVGKNNTSSVLPDYLSHPGLGPDDLGPILDILAKQKSSASFSDWKKMDLPSS